MNEEVTGEALRICIEYVLLKNKSGIITPQSIWMIPHDRFHLMPLSRQAWTLTQKDIRAVYLLKKEGILYIQKLPEGGQFPLMVMPPILYKESPFGEFYPSGLLYVYFPENAPEKWIENHSFDNDNKVQENLLGAIPKSRKTIVHINMIKKLLNNQSPTKNYILAKCIVPGLTAVKYNENVYKKDMQERVKSRIDIINNYIRAFGYTVQFSTKTDTSKISKFIVVNQFEIGGA